MIISRHFVNTGEKKVHFRKCGEGAPLVLLHQSPRTGAEFDSLMREWGNYFTCIAPDIPGFGLSDPLPDGSKLDDFADVIIGLLDELNIDKSLCYGFHSGASILFNALCRYPDRFTAGAFAGIAAFTAEEKRVFTGKYLQANPPQDYGQHLVWLWSRLVEQTWFFPWYLPKNNNRLSISHCDPARIHPMVLDVLLAGDEYLNGYRAVIEGDLINYPENPPNAYLCAYDGDPLQEHMNRLGELPANWHSEKASNSQEMLKNCREFLLKNANMNANVSCALDLVSEENGEGFVLVQSKDFVGNIYWRGDKVADTLIIHAPFEDVNSFEIGKGEIGFDLVGHGHSDSWRNNEIVEIKDYVEVLDAACKTVGVKIKKIVTRGLSAGLGRILNEKYQIVLDNKLYRPISQITKGELYDNLPDIIPDKNGLYLIELWNFVRRGIFFFPWFCIDKGHEIDFEEDKVTPKHLQKLFCATIRARSGKMLSKLILDLV